MKPKQHDNSLTPVDIICLNCENYARYLYVICLDTAISLLSISTS